ncbi:uncharacterized protein LOC9641028, partial [Selaginella moellendorffii]|uniref:uncharacterized protein LOC9641028 n=1 Tax=Selaginella moellendorffii TaxID=88036 RepID=UPI000D1CB489
MESSDRMEAPAMIPRKRRGFRRPSLNPDSTARKKLKFKDQVSLDIVSADFLLPNGEVVSGVEIKRSSYENVDALLDDLAERPADGPDGVRKLDWSKEMWVEDESGERIDDIGKLFSEGARRKILVQDGNKRTVHRYWWNVTPEVEMLERLPDGYTLETALADHVDNALQAVWENQPGFRRLVSVEIDQDTITIFDTGMGMDATAQDSIEKWGTVGASNHRNVHRQGIGGDPPFLKPYLGKYGAGGVAAALFLGLSVEVRSKTRKSKRVVSLKFSKAAMETGGGSRIWRTRGGFHLMTEEEAKKSPHGSFTCVKISDLKSSACIEGQRQYWVLKQVKQMLKDIYSLYIQYDGVGSSSGTMTPVEFEVNGENLLEELGGEITSCNQHSSPGEPFILDLRLVSASSEEAHARLTCQYFPSIKGREKLSDVIEDLKSCRKDFKENFDTFPRVGLRWLGRLLPNARWNSMPFMDAASKKSVLRWIKRVKVFADVDAGFHPTPSKTKLVEDHPFTTALKQLGSMEEDTVPADVKTTIYFQSKVLEPPQVIAEFANWTKRMHEEFDREVEFGDDPTYVIGQSELKRLLKVEKEVLCFHKCLKDPRGDWRAGDMVKLQKELYKGKQNFYGVIEWFFCDGIDEQYGEVKMVCRPVELLTTEEESKIETAQICSFKLNRCRWFPCSVLNSEKCHRMTPSEWHTQENRLKGKLPAFVELLNNDDRRVFGGKHLHRSNLTFEAGYVLQIDSFLVVVRPQQGTGASCKQAAIVADPHRMKAEVHFSSKDRDETKMQGCYYAEVEARNGIKGIYAFAAGTIFPDLCKAGKYKVEFSIDGHPDLKPAVWEVNIKSLEFVSRWHVDTKACTGITLEELVTQNFTVQGFDTYDNLVPFSQPCPNLCMVLETLESTRLSTVSLGRESVSFSQKKDKMNVGNFIVRGCILPAHDARLCFYVGNQKLGHWRCQVYPGKLARLELVNSSLELAPSGSMFCVKQPLDPDSYFPCMVFKGFDEWGNSVSQGTRMRLQLSGVHLSQQEQPKRSYIGREVTGLNVHVVDEAGNVDTAIGGTISMSWDKDICYVVNKGQCQLRGLTVPKTPGLWEGRAWHSDYQLMSLAFEIQVELAAACKLVCEAQVIAGGCGEEIALKFEARDELNLPGFLSNEIVEQMEVEVFPEEDYLTDENVLLSRRISSTEDMKYSLRVVLDGKEGFYVVTLKNAMQALSWRVYLGCGDVHRLVPFCGKRNELLKALMTADAGRRFSVCR